MSNAAEKSSRMMMEKEADEAREELPCLQWIWAVCVEERRAKELKEGESKI